MEGQNPTEPATSGNVAGGEGQPAVASPPPAYPQPVYSSSPAYYPPPQYAPYPATAPPGKSHNVRNLLLVIGLVLVVMLGAVGAGALVVSASLANTYSPSTAVVDYLAAQKKGDYQFMYANANYLSGSGSFKQFFDGGALGALLALPQNTDISDVKVASTAAVDSNTQTVNVTMTWAGHHVVRAYTLHRDLTRVHYRFYNSWRVDIPFETIHISVPSQPGYVNVDGVPVPQALGTFAFDQKLDNNAAVPLPVKDIQVIQGFHQVTMDGTDLYDKTSIDADAIEGGATVAFTNKISASGLTLAATTLRNEFVVCNYKKYHTCLNHLYHSPGQPGYVYFWSLPGYPEIDFTTYKFTLTSDPTVNMKLVISATTPKVTASGVCRYTLTVDGGRRYLFKGTWTGTLDTTGGVMSYASLNLKKCLDSKA